MREEFAQHFQYRKEKLIQFSFNDEKKEMFLVALSARKTEEAMIEAQDFYKRKAKRLTESGESLKDIYKLQDRVELEEGFLELERGGLEAKAARTIVEKDEDYPKKLADKTQVLVDKRREEIQDLSTELLIETLVRREMIKQLDVLWQYATLTASLVQGLCTIERIPLFTTLEALTEALAPEQIEQLLMIWTEFVSTRGNAQVFHEPCTSNG